MRRRRSKAQRRRTMRGGEEGTVDMGRAHLLPKQRFRRRPCHLNRPTICHEPLTKRKNISKLQDYW